MRPLARNGSTSVYARYKIQQSIDVKRLVFEMKFTKFISKTLLILLCSAPSLAPKPLC